VSVKKKCATLTCWWC